MDPNFEQVENPRGAAHGENGHAPKDDPYNILLRVNRDPDDHEPPHAYLLLGLDIFEDQESSIHVSAERARRNLQKKFGSVEPAIWRKVFNEVEDAIETLTKPELKDRYDTKLKNKLQGKVDLSQFNNTGNGHSENGNGSNGHGSGQLIKCPNCHEGNPVNRKFCHSCGTPLTVACPQCGCKNTVHEKFCGDCGLNLTEGIEDFEQKTRQIFEEAQRLREEGKHDEACRALRELTQPQHEGEKKAAERASELIEKYISERNELKVHANALVDEMQEQLERKNIELILKEVGKIPPILRPSKLQKIYDEAESQHQEITDLTEEIKISLKDKRFNRLLPKVDRLLRMKPDDEKIKKLRTQLLGQLEKSNVSRKAKLTDKAKTYLAEFRYDRAAEVLSEVPEDVRTDKFNSYYKQVCELALIYRDIQTQPHATETLLGMMKRLVKMFPKDPKSLEALRRLSKLLELKKAEKKIEVPWKKPPQISSLGLPLRSNRGFRRIKSEKLKDNEHFLDNISRFYVCTGLALQGLGLSKIDFNLMPSSGGMLGKLNSVISRKPKGEQAWGIDISNSSLKAILLKKEVSTNEQGERVTQVVAENCHVIEHRKSLSRVDTADRLAITRNSIEKFLEAIGEDALQNCIICMNLHSSDVLGKFFNLPPVEKKLLPKTIEYETRHQIPFPIDELEWGFHIWSESNSGEPDFESLPSCRSVVIATRKDAHSTRVNHWKSFGLTPQIIQCDQLALHNFIDYDYLDSANSKKEDETIALLDVGSDTSNLIVSQSNYVWFRALSVGSDNFTRDLVRYGSCTFNKAEELIRRPDEAESIYEFNQIIEPALKHFQKEISVSLNHYEGANRDYPINTIFLIGGGAQLFGLERYLQYGDEFDLG